MKDDKISLINHQTMDMKQYISELIMKKYLLNYIFFYLPPPTEIKNLVAKFELLPA